MAIYRSVQLSFWTDNKVEDEFTPEDKFFYLYLMTNPQTNICGCYEVSYSQMTNQTGYSKDTINRLLDRFENVHKVIRFSKEHKEILILNWYKYNWSKSLDTLKGVENVAQYIKCEEFRKYVLQIVECLKKDMPIKEKVEANGNKKKGETKDEETHLEVIKIIVNYLNAKCGTNYRSSTPNTKKHITARIKDGYTLEDFYVVIDKKYEEWAGTEMQKFLCPDTLFGSKFEKYLNQSICLQSSESKWVNGWREA